MDVAFFSGAKTLGHIVKHKVLHAGVVKLGLRTKEVINPTPFAKIFLDGSETLDTKVYYSYNSLYGLPELEKEVEYFQLLLGDIRPRLVVGDKLPQLMMACYKCNIPYLSVTHESQVSVHFGDMTHHNLRDFDEYWDKNKLTKPVTDPSFFFYRNWGNTVVFVDERKLPDWRYNELSRMGYHISYIRPLTLMYDNPGEHLQKINEVMAGNKYRKTILFNLSSYASDETDRQFIALARTHRDCFFIQPRIENANLLEMIDRDKLPNVYVPKFIDYFSTQEISPALDLIVCLPGVGTLNLYKNFPGEIMAFYAHDEGRINAESFGHPRFSFHPLDQLGQLLERAMLTETAIRHVGSAKVERPTNGNADQEGVRQFNEIVKNYLR